MALQIANLDDLVTRVSRRAGGSSDPQFPDATQEAVALAEAEMNVWLRVPEMMVRSRETVNERWESMPPNFLQMRTIYLVGNLGEDNEKDIPLQSVSPEKIAWYSHFRGNPKAFSVVGSQYRIEPRTEADEYTVRLIYYAKVPDISLEDSPDTTILNRYPSIYFYGTLANLSDWLAGDPRVQMWRASFEREVLAANRAAGTRMFSSNAA